MLHVSQPAAVHLRQALSDAAGGNESFRVMIRENCLEVVPDAVRPGDVTLRDAQDVLLVMDPATAERLSEHTIEYDETIARLVFV